MEAMPTAAARVAAATAGRVVVAATAAARVAPAAAARVEGAVRGTIDPGQLMVISDMGN
jgi:hypothetical protein